MGSRYAEFDRSKLKIQPLSARRHDLELGNWLDARPDPIPFSHPALATIAERIRSARQRDAAVILMMGAHVLRAGVSSQIIDLLERKLLTHVAMNGAGSIHEYELARIGATTESVARYIRTGEFGLWQETGELNDLIRRGAREKLGLGEAIGKFLAKSDYPYKNLSVLAAAYQQHIPATVHVGIGYDIIHEHPNCDGAALGETSYRDFLIFAEAITRLEHGVLLNFGSAVM